MGDRVKSIGLALGFVLFASWPVLAQQQPIVPRELAAQVPGIVPAPPDEPVAPEDAPPAEGVVAPEPPVEDGPVEGAEVEPEAPIEPEAALAMVEGGGGNTPDWQSLAAVQLTNPQDFGTGAFGYEVAIGVPPFRGLEPSIALSYQSGQPLQYSGNGAGWMGIGWRLEGIPTIERGLRGGGSPYFNASDAFLLGGEELVLCAPEMVSPSCQAGGTHATRVESYRRVIYSAATNYWTVTDRDGTTYEFRPTVETQAVNPADPVAVLLANSYRWLLRKITDTHGNEINFAYTCSAAVYCRIDAITYGGAEIKFYWETRPDPYAYATGVNTISVTHHLKTIDVKFASNRVRTYTQESHRSPSTASSSTRTVMVEPTQ